MNYIFLFKWSKAVLKRVLRVRRSKKREKNHRIVLQFVVSANINGWPCESRRCNWWWLSEEVTSLTRADVEPADPKPLVIELILPWDPNAAVAAADAETGARSSDGLVTWLELDIDPLDAVFVKTAGGRQKACKINIFLFLIIYFFN